MEASGKIIIGIIILAILFIVGLMSIRAIIKMNEIKEYDVMIIDNHEYSTSEIENIDYPCYGYGNQIIITFKNGTVIYTNDYILKNR